MLDSAIHLGSRQTNLSAATVFTQYLILTTFMILKKTLYYSLVKFSIELQFLPMSKQNLFVAECIQWTSFRPPFEK